MDRSEVQVTFFNAHLRSSESLLRLTLHRTKFMRKLFFMKQKKIQIERFCSFSPFPSIFEAAFMRSVLYRNSVKDARG